MLEIAFFAAGCFWGVEAAFLQMPGVVQTEVGYMGGTTPDPTYKQVCTGTTGHAETVKVTFDPSKVKYGQLLELFWDIHDPTTRDRQGPDVGTQYRSAIFCSGDSQLKEARTSRKALEGSARFRGPIVTQIQKAGPFYRAEEYHQKYFQKHGGPSCHIPSGNEGKQASGKFEIQKSDADWKAMLTPEQFSVTRKKGTEPAFRGKYWDSHEKGLYTCVCCGAPLFRSEAKYDSGSGWPSFYKAAGNMGEEKDTSHGMVRTEIFCSRCGAHLGHLFDDGPDPTGLRYCVNSASLEFQKDQ